MLSPKQVTTTRQKPVQTPRNKFFKKLDESYFAVPAGSPSRGWDVVVYIFGIKQPSLPTPFYSVPGSISVFIALSTVFIP